MAPGDGLVGAAPWAMGILPVAPPGGGSSPAAPAGQAAGRPPARRSGSHRAHPHAAAPAPGSGIADWTPEEVAGVEEALHADIQRLRQELDMAQADLADLIADSGDGAGDDQADAGSKTFERENEMWVNANTRDMLEQAMHALARLADGTYGLCESCGQPIRKGRLQAFPRATLCLSCKQAEERR